MNIKIYIIDNISEIVDVFNDIKNICPKSQISMKWNKHTGNLIEPFDVNWNGDYYNGKFHIDRGIYVLLKIDNLSMDEQLFFRIKYTLT